MLSMFLHSDDESIQRQQLSSGLSVSSRTLHVPPRAIGPPICVSCRKVYQRLMKTVAVDKK